MTRILTTDSRATGFFDRNQPELIRSELVHGENPDRNRSYLALDNNGFSAIALAIDPRNPQSLGNSIIKNRDDEFSAGTQYAFAIFDENVLHTELGVNGSESDHKLFLISKSISERPFFAIESPLQSTYSDKSHIGIIRNDFSNILGVILAFRGSGVDFTINSLNNSNVLRNVEKEYGYAILWNKTIDFRKFIPNRTFQSIEIPSFRFLPSKENVLVAIIFGCALALISNYFRIINLSNYESCIIVGGDTNVIRLRKAPILDESAIIKDSFLMKGSILKIINKPNPNFYQVSSEQIGRYLSENPKVFIEKAKCFEK